MAGRLCFRPEQVTWVVESFDNSYAPGRKTFDFDINEISSTPQRAKAVDFSSGYCTANQGVLLLKNSTFATAGSLTALKDARTGVQVATNRFRAEAGR